MLRPSRPEGRHLSRRRAPPGRGSPGRCDGGSRRGFQEIEQHTGQVDHGVLSLVHDGIHQVQPVEGSLLALSRGADVSHDRTWCEGHHEGPVQAAAQAVQEPWLEDESRGVLEQDDDVGLR